MRIPHIINENTRVAYTPSPECLELVGEDERKLLSENFVWDKDHCPTLEDYCVKSIGKHFKEKPLLDELPCADRVHLLEILPINLPLELIIPLIDDEYYWRRRYNETFGLVLKSKPAHWTWKSLYLERHVQELVEQAQPQYNDEDTFDEILDLCGPYVSRLFVEQLQCWKPPLTMEKEDIPEEYPIDHINFAPIFKKLQNVVEFDLIYGMKNVGEDFNWNMFKISVGDCVRLGRALLELKNLKIVRIHRSRLEYKHCQALLQGIIRHKCVEELDLSNCEIGDAGALCVAYLLQDGSNLKVLNLANNQIGKIGSEGLGYAMIGGNCDSLMVLNLKMNPLGTDGAMGIMRALVRCTIPKKLSLAACLFEEDTPLKVCQMLKLNESLKKLDISCNWFGEDGGESLVEAVSFNTTLEWLDTRDTDISEEQQIKLNELLARNRKIIEADTHGREEDDEYVLDFLRDGTVVLPDCFREKERLKREAERYLLQGLVEAISSENRNRPSGVITVGYRGSFQFGKDGLADVKFRKLSRILVSGRVALCRDVFGETLNESRDPDHGQSERYTSRFFLKHSFLEQAFDMLIEQGFKMVGSCGSGTAGGAAELKPGVDAEENRWNHYNEFVFVRE